MSQLPKQPAEVTVPTSADVARLAGVSRATRPVVPIYNNATVRMQL
ncbi:LacI family DNA-binding transcriptional regulator [Streptomyces californicus]